MRLAIIFGTAMLVFGSCSYSVSDIAAKDVPEKPTYELDVKPLLADHCLLCHSFPPNRGAPRTSRLDMYDDDPVHLGVVGAQTMNKIIGDKVAQNLMPPAARDGDGLGPNGRRLIDLWVAAGAPR